MSEATEGCSRLFNKHSLFFNVPKSNFINFRTKQCQTQLSESIYIGSNILNHTNNTMFLGLEFDDTLNWDLHDQKITKKINSDIYVHGKC